MRMVLARTVGTVGVAAWETLRLTVPARADLTFSDATPAALLATGVNFSVLTRIVFLPRETRKMAVSLGTNGFITTCTVKERLVKAAGCEPPKTPSARVASVGGGGAGAGGAGVGAGGGVCAAAVAGKIASATSATSASPARLMRSPRGARTARRRPRRLRRRSARRPRRRALSQGV